MEFMRRNINLYEPSGSGPGEWFHQHTGFRKVGLIVHLGTILPCGILVIFQFIPSIRHRVILFHRINGYIIIVLFLISNAGTLTITRHAFGGGHEVQLGLGLLVLITTTSVGMACYNIRCLQIEQHRAWMLRAMFYMGSIVTIRPLLEIISRIISNLGAYYEVWPCEKIGFTWQFYKISVSYLAAYSMCALPSDPAKLPPGYDPVAIVKADDNGMEPAQIGANLDLSFGLALWLALFLHIVGVEIYLQLTPRDSQRLRMVSYERQKAAGYANPGNAGLVVQKFGDAEPWVPSVETGQPM
ncbi:hypothetical protein ACJ73_02398 [Blastomyces percursus]|uniref:Uncharacterized protein n=1 Tax=Blastomyces percursus TaxID=1658174 RepID=A0A1J9RDZ3_9EURO|nr:hypothetical protein ACJ73_02398 [Blastomyces percursus]